MKSGLSVYQVRSESHSGSGQKEDSPDERSLLLLLPSVSGRDGKVSKLDAWDKGQTAGVLLRFMAHGKRRASDMNTARKTSRTSLI